MSDNKAPESIGPLDPWLQQWGRWLPVTTYVLAKGEPEPERPEKPWHVIVYGAGRHSQEAQEGKK
jgi:hypothetical protein